MRSIVRKPSSKFAMAIALATGTAVGIAGIATPAVAQKKKEKAAKKDYSKPFIAAYQPLVDLVSAETPDIAAMKAGIPAVQQAVSTDDDRFAYGNLVYSIGTKAEDMALQYQGLTAMLESGKVPLENQPQYNFQTGQIAYQLDRFADSRRYIQAAMDLGYTQNDPEVLIAETYFSEDNFAEGVKYLDRVIRARMDAGQPVDGKWARRGLAMAYNNGLEDQARDFAYYYVVGSPSDESWGDAIAVSYNTAGYENPELLDLLRLARRTNAMRDKNMYMEYIDAADPRKLPLEVQTVIDEGVSAGMLSAEDRYLNETRGLASKRVREDESELPSLERDARGASANLSTVVAAGDAFLSYGEGAKAEEFYRKALSMQGVNTPLVLTRLGIAQADQGKAAAAQETFAQVEGLRKNIARLWSAYAAANASADVDMAPATMNDGVM